MRAFHQVFNTHAGGGEDRLNVLPGLIDLSIDIGRHAAVECIADLAGDIKPPRIGRNFNGVAIRAREEWRRSQDCSS